MTTTEYEKLIEPYRPAIEEARDFVAKMRSTLGARLDGNRIAAILAGLHALIVAKHGVKLTNGELLAIQLSDQPWQELERIVAPKHGADGKTAQQISELVRGFHEQESKIQYYQDQQRLIFSDPKQKHLYPTGRYVEGGKDQARTYQEEHRKLTDEGIASEEAHRILVEERGFAWPYVSDADEGVVVLAQQLLLMETMHPELLSDIDYARIIGMDNVVSVEEYVREEVFEGTSQEWEELITDVHTLPQYTTLPTSIGENIENSNQAAENKTFLGEVPDANVYKAPPLGVDEGYTITIEKPRYAFDYKKGGYNEVGTYEVEKEPIYFSGMQFQEFPATQSSEMTLYKQSLLYEAGWLTQEQMTEEWGVGGTYTFGAMATAMETANRQGYVDWMAAAEAASQDRDREAASDPDNDRGRYAEPIAVFTPEPYMAKDPDYLAQVVKQTFRNELGREPTATEVADLIGNLSGEFRAEYQAQVAKARAEFEAEQAAREATMVWDPYTGQYVPIGSDIGPLDEKGEDETEEEFEERVKRGVDPAYAMEQDEIEAYRRKYGIDDPYPEGPWSPEQEQAARGGGTMTMPTPYSGVEVDPIASFQEHFERYFADELERNRDRAASRSADAGVQAAIMMMNQAIGGG
jgi:hypothetical protein